VSHPWNHSMLIMINRQNVIKIDQILNGSIVTPTPVPVSPIGCSVGISGSSVEETGAAPVLFETGCLGVRI